MSVTKPAGRKYIYKNYPSVTTHEGLFVMKVVQVPGKKPVDGKPTYKAIVHGVTF